MVETWRVLEDATEPPNIRALPPAPATAATSTRLWLFLGAAAVAVTAVAGWLLVSTPSRGVLTVNAAHQGQRPALDGVSAVPADQSGASATLRADELVVEVDGAVRKPGVYRFGSGARVSEAITAAGGFSARVDASAAQGLNLAARLTDGQQVHVPARAEAATAGPAAAAVGAAGGGITPAAGGPAGPVNMNTATSAELEALPGIGPATAAKIIAARATRPFRTVDELRERKVVGEATFEKIRSLVSVN